MKNKYYVYFLIDPRNSQVFYVGKGCGNRYNHHLYEARKHRSKQHNIMKCDIINDILRAGLSMKITKIEENLSECDALKIESDHIKKFGRLIDGSGILTNIVSEDRIRPGVFRKISQYTLDGELIKVFDSIIEASENTGIAYDSLQHCCSKYIFKNKTKRSIGGYRWSYFGELPTEYKTPEQLNYQRKKPICKYTKDGILLKIYKSAQDAYLETNIHYSHISMCCNKRKRKMAGGYCWCFLGETPRLPNLSLSRYDKF